MEFWIARLGISLMPNKDKQTSLRQSFCRLASPKKLILNIKNVLNRSEVKEMTSSMTGVKVQIEIIVRIWCPTGFMRFLNNKLIDCHFLVGS